MFPATHTPLLATGRTFILVKDKKDSCKVSSKGGGSHLPHITIPAGTAVPGDPSLTPYCPGWGTLKKPLLFKKIIQIIQIKVNSKF